MNQTPLQRTLRNTLRSEGMNDNGMTAAERGYLWQGAFLGVFGTVVVLVLAWAMIAWI
jgi:ABC-type lipoprotein release transport system permease subunit